VIVWKTHASDRPGSLKLPTAEARRAIRARRKEAEDAMRWGAQTRLLGRFLRFEASPTWGLLAVYQVVLIK